MNILKVLTDKRRKGNLGEDAAARFLTKNGYRILDRGFVGNHSEIDIVASCEKTTVFVEVKTRSVGSQSPMEPRPASAVTPEKQRKIISAARIFMKKRRLETRMRFDIIEVLLERVNDKEEVKDIRHLISAFDLNTAYDKAHYFGKY